MSTATITLVDGTKLTAITVAGGPKFINSLTRDTLTFTFPEETDIVELDNLFNEANCETISITIDKDTYIHKGYTIRGKLSKEQIEVEQSTAETPTEYQTVITVEMAQRTYTETSIKSLNESVDDIIISLLEG